VLNLINEGPSVVGLLRTGVHHQPTHLVLTFNLPMNAATMQDLRNYTPHSGQPARLRRSPPEADPDQIGRLRPCPAGRHLDPASPRLPLHDYYRLTVSGLGPHPVADVKGNPLTGTDTGGEPGDYIAMIHRYGLWHPARSAAQVLKAKSVPAGPRSQTIPAAWH